MRLAKLFVSKKAIALANQNNGMKKINGVGVRSANFHAIHGIGQLASIHSHLLSSHIPLAFLNISSAAHSLLRISTRASLCL